MTGRTTELRMLVDESGSMAPMRREVVEGLNAHLRDLRKKGRGASSTSVVVTAFDSQATHVLREGPLKAVTPIDLDEYRPGALTPLYDALGGMLLRKASADRTLVVVITDGLENASKEWTASRLKRLITKRTKQGWSFLYLASDPLVAAQGRRTTGAQSVSVYDPTPAGMVANVRGMTHATLDYMNSNKSGAVATASAAQAHASSLKKEKKEKTS